MNRILRLCALLVALFGFSFGAHAQSPASCVTGTNVYYVDSGAGSDSHTQTQAKSKSTPWAHQPYMANFTGSYTHTAGDCFVFKGGSTWSNASFPLKVAASGISTAPDYYGVDVTWWSGTNSGVVNTSGTQVTRVSGAPFQSQNTSWVSGSITINSFVYTIASVQSPKLLTLTSSAGTQSGVAYSNSLFKRPIFNSGGTAVSGSNIEFDMSTNAVNWITVDNIEWTGHYWNGVSAFNTNNTIDGDVGSSNGFVIENNWAHGWSHAPYAGSNANTQDGWNWYYGSPASLCTTCAALWNVIDGNAADGGDPQSGQGIDNMYRISYNFVCNMTDNLVGAGHQVDHNEVCNTNDSFDQVSGNSGGQHGDSIFVVAFPTDSTQLFFDNLVYGSSQGTEGPLFIEGGAQHLDGSAVTVYVFNNTLYYGQWGPPIVLDNRCFGSGCNSAVWNYHVWNNTVVNNATGCPPNVFCTGPGVPGANTSTYACIRVGAGGGSTGLGIVDLENNHCGSNYSPSSINTSCMGATVTNRIFDCGGNGNQTGGSFPVATPTDLDDIITGLTALASDGYVLSSNFAETSAGNPSVGQGANLTSLATGALAPLAIGFNPVNPTANGNARPSTGAWDSSSDEFAASTAVTLSPSAESYGLFNVGASSSPVTFTVTNNNATTATSISPTDTDSAEFVITNSGAGSCAAAGGSLATSASCTFTVTFSPTSAGAKTPTLSVSYSGGDGASPQTAALSGTGVNTTAPAAAIFGIVKPDPMPGQPPILALRHPQSKSPLDVCRREGTR